MKKKIGRPTTYKEEYVKSVDDYLATCVDEEYDWTKSTSSGKVESESWEHRTRVKLPTLEGFSTFIDVPLSNLNEWRAQHKDFSVALNKITKEQKDRLIAKGLSGDYNPTIAKLILASNHKMTDRTDVTTDDKPITVEIISYAKQKPR